MSSTEVPAPARSRNYVPDEIILYGVPLNVNNHAKLPFGDDQLRLEMRRRNSVSGEFDDVISQADISIALVYGYGFEGHCYRFDRPKIMIFKAAGGEKPAVGCGFDGFPAGQSYSMWRIRSKTELMELNTSYDTAEVLVLQTNLPGKRAPNTYSNNMQLAHRGGRLTQG